MGAHWDGVAAWIIEQHPRSVYAGFVAATGIGPLPEERAERLRRWLARNTTRDALREHRMLRLAEWEVFTAYKKAVSAEGQAAKARAAAALKAALADGPKSERARKRAAELSNEMEALSELEALTPR